MDKQHIMLLTIMLPNLLLCYYWECRGTVGKRIGSN